MATRHLFCFECADRARATNLEYEWTSVRIRWIGPDPDKPEKIVQREKSISVCPACARWFIRVMDSRLASRRHKVYADLNRRAWKTNV